MRWIWRAGLLLAKARLALGQPREARAALAWAFRAAPPEDRAHVLALTPLSDMNQAALRMYNAASKEELVTRVAEVLTPSIAETATEASTCPTAAPQAAGAPEWTVSGTTGSVAVTGVATPPTFE